MPVLPDLPSYSEPLKRGRAHRLARAVRCSVLGLRAAWREEAAFREELALGIIVVPLGLWLGATPAERALLIGSWGLVVVVELLNSGLEAVVDRIGPERHALSGRAKDLGSAAVFASLINAVLVWLLIVV